MQKNIHFVNGVCTIKKNFNCTLKKFICIFNKINQEIYLLINNNKFVDSTQKLNRKLRKYVLLTKMIEYLFKFEIGSLKF